MTTEARHGAAAKIGAEARYRSLARVLLFVVGSRLVLWAVADYAYRTYSPWLHGRARHDFGAHTLASLLRWDVWWYVSVVEDGYHYRPEAASNVAFLPGFPAMIGLMVRALGVSPGWAAFVISNAAFGVGLVVLWSWVAERAGLAAAERAALWLVVYPFSFFFDVGYAESIYFLFCVLALRQADRGHAGSAALWASFATLTRPMGLFLALAFAWAPVGARRSGRAVAPLEWLPALAPIAALGAFSVYLFVVHGTPFATVNAQRTGWGVGHHWTLFRLPGRSELLRQMVDVFHVLVPLPLMWLSFRAFRRLGPGPGIYAVLAAALGVFLGGDSVGREALAVVPVFAVLGIERLSPRTTTLAQACSFALLVVFTEAFVLGAFVG
jgi:hypothetical protein